MTARATETLSVEEAGERLGISRSLAYEEARKGSIAGVQVLRVGRRFVIPRAPFERALGVAINDEARAVDGASGSRGDVDGSTDPKDGVELAPHDPRSQSDDDETVHEVRF